MDTINPYAFFLFQRASAQINNPIISYICIYIGRLQLRRHPLRLRFLRKRPHANRIILALEQPLRKLPLRPLRGLLHAPRALPRLPNPVASHNNRVWRRQLRNVPRYLYRFVDHRLRRLAHPVDEQVPRCFRRRKLARCHGYLGRDLQACDARDACQAAGGRVQADLRLGQAKGCGWGGYHNIAAHTRLSQPTIIMR
jgi:hypothetical protein